MKTNPKQFQSFTAAVRKSLKRLELLAETQVRSVTAILGLEDERVFRLLREANEKCSADVLQSLFFDVSKAVMERGWPVECMNEYVRAFQLYSNHVLTSRIGNDSCSRVFEDMYENLPKKYEAELMRLPELFLAVHNNIDDITTALYDNYAKMVENVRRRIAKFDPTHARDMSAKDRDDLVCRKERLKECASVAHHALNLFVRIYPEELVKKSVKKMASIALDVVLQFNLDAPVRRWVPYTRKELSAFGEWKGSMGDVGLTMYATVRDEAPDPEIYILTADDESEEVPYEPLQKGRGGIPAGNIIGTTADKLRADEYLIRVQILFDRYGCDDKDALEKVKQWVYESGEGVESTKIFHEQFLSLFPKFLSEDGSVHYELLGAAVDAWNVFPHKKLNGKSPLEMMEEHKKEKSYQNDRIKPLK